MKEKESLPIVGMTDYGTMALLKDMGGKTYLCSPHLPFEKLTPENTVFFCMQHDKLSPIEIFRIVMWVLEESVIGGYESNVEDTINFLKSNGITMRPGKIELTFTIEKTEKRNYELWSYDDRDIKMGHYDSLSTMAYAFYNVFLQMSREFNQFFEVVLFFRGDEGEEFSTQMEAFHNPQQFDLATLNI